MIVIDTKEELETLKKEFESLRYDDKDFKKQYNKNDFKEWLKDNDLFLNEVLK